MDITIKYPKPISVPFREIRSGKVFNPIEGEDIYMKIFTTGSTRPGDINAVNLTSGKLVFFDSLEPVIAGEFRQLIWEPIQYLEEPKEEIS